MRICSVRASHAITAVLQRTIPRVSALPIWCCISSEVPPCVGLVLQSFPTLLDARERARVRAGEPETRSRGPKGEALLYTVLCPCEACGEAICLAAEQTVLPNSTLLALHR